MTSMLDFLQALMETDSKAVAAGTTFNNSNQNFWVASAADYGIGADSYMDCSDLTC